MSGRDKRRRIFLAVAFVCGLGWIGTPSATAGGGPDAEPKIVGGRPADAGEYPFMVAILNEAIDGDDYQKQYCGGSLIAGGWVLTAAHCVDGRTAGQVAVAVGRTDLTSNQGQRLSVTAIHVHPSFGSPTSLSHDVALLDLNGSVRGIGPITLASASDDSLEAAGTPLVVIGWGNTSGRGRASYPNSLQEGEVVAVTDGECGSVYGASFDAPTMVCAAAPGVDSCQGDSGGPLFSTASGTPVQVGTVSWGNGCARKRFPGVYGEVNNPSMRSWISQTAGV